MTTASAITLPAPRRRAFTMVELILSMAIVTIACTAVFSVTTLLLRANSASADTGAAAQNPATRDALDQITTDLKMATSITERTPTSIAFTVPDRTGDGAPETIRYAWAGSSGSPLTRQFNSATPVTVLASTQAFALSYLDQTVTSPLPIISSEQQLFVYDDASSNANQNLKDAAWAAQTFKPALPADALSWSITRVKIEGKCNNANIFYAIEVRAIDAGNKPTGSALASVSFNSSTLASSATWIDLTFPTPASNLNPTAGYAIIVRGTNSTKNAVSLIYDNSAVVNTSRWWTTTTNSGSSWANPVDNKAMQFYVYGTVTTPPP